MYEKIEPEHSPVATEEPQDMACSCNCTCNCVCGSGRQSAKGATLQGSEFGSDMIDSAPVPT